MCALIAMCAYCTEENGKLKYLKETLDSIAKTVDLEKHQLHIIDNSPDNWVIPHIIKDCNVKIVTMATLHTPTSNLGTAGGINLAIKQRKPNQFLIKCDDDWTTDHIGWVDELEAQMQKRPDLGILGLKRDDIWQRPDNPDPRYRTHMDGKLEICEDIMGTCTMFSPQLLDKIGYMNQPSNYGFDDVLISVRSIVAGFTNAFLPHIKITNLDIVPTEYTQWKKDEAAVYIDEISKLCDMYRSGKISYYYNPFEL